MSAISDAPFLEISIALQRLRLCRGHEVLVEYPVSTARNGPGEQRDTGCTPRGEHRIRIKIGEGCAPGTVFRARRPTGEIYSPALAAIQPQRDWILSRILWLSGSEVGHNRGGQCDTLRRFIYIHGCPDSAPMGVPLSHGCIRMRNTDLIELFGRVSRGTRVLIRTVPWDN